MYQWGMNMLSQTMIPRGNSSQPYKAQSLNLRLKLDTPILLDMKYKHCLLLLQYMVDRYLLNTRKLMCRLYSNAPLHR